MSLSSELVVFTLDEQSFALELATVHRVLRAIEVTPLPHAPAVILGVINVQGELSAVVNLRHRFRLPEREISPSDQFVLVNMTTQEAKRRVALVVDAVIGIVTIEKENIIVGEEIVPDLEYVQGIAKLADDLILIHNLERCLSLDEERILHDALTKMSNE